MSDNVRNRKPKSDAERRHKQALKFARIIAVSRLLSTKAYISEEVAKALGEQLGVSSRTIYRDMAVIREANHLLADEEVGTTVDFLEHETLKQIAFKLRQSLHGFRELFDENDPSSGEVIREFDEFVGGES